MTALATQADELFSNCIGGDITAADKTTATVMSARDTAAALGVSHGSGHAGPSSARIARENSPNGSRVR